MGLSYAPSKESYGWRTGDTFSYTNWQAGEPSTGKSEYYVDFSSSNGTWSKDVNENSFLNGTMVEYNQDHHPIRNPDNGHYYQLIVHSDITWPAAKTAAENYTFNGANGKWGTITSASENESVKN